MPVVRAGGIVEGKKGKETRRDPPLPFLSPVLFYSPPLPPPTTTFAVNVE